MYRQLIMFLLILPNLSMAADARQPVMPRGEMLYRNHCIECHNQQIHWREGRIAKLRWRRETGRSLAGGYRRTLDQGGNRGCEPLPEFNLLFL